MRIGLHGLAALAPWQSLIVALGQGAELVAADDRRCDALVICDGMTNGAGAAVLAFARGGGPVLGVGEGFQALCAIGVLPGRVTAPGGDDGALARAHVRVEGRATPFTSAIPAGRVMAFSGAPAVGLRYDIGEPETLEARGQVIFRYCDAAGGPLSLVDEAAPTPKSGPLSRLRERARVRADLASGGARRASQLPLTSVPLIAPKLRAQAIAGVCSEAGNVVGVLAAGAALDAMAAQLLASLRMHLRGKR